MTKPVRYFLRGILANVIILVALTLFLLINSALSYRGRCGVFWFFGGEGHPCTRSEYVREEMAFGLIGLVGLPETWLVILPALCVLPFLGYVIGLRRRENVKPAGS